MASGLTISTSGLSFPPSAQGLGGSDQEWRALLSDLLQLAWVGEGWFRDKLRGPTLSQALAELETARLALCEHLWWPCGHLPPHPALPPKARAMSLYPNHQEDGRHVGGPRPCPTLCPVSPRPCCLSPSLHPLPSVSLLTSPSPTPFSFPSPSCPCHFHFPRGLGPIIPPPPTCSLISCPVT